MIHGFLNAVQQDFAFLAEYQTLPIDEQDRKIQYVAIRMFAVLGMALSVITGFRSFNADSAIGGIFKLASAVGLYILSRDIFVIAVNSEKALGGHVLAVGKGWLDDIKDYWKGSKDLHDVPRHPYSEGTFFRSMWDAVLSEVQE